MNHTHEQKTGDTSGKAAAHRQAKRMDQDTSVENGISYEFAEMANNSAQATQLKTIQTAANRYTQSQSMPIPTQAQPVGENRTGLPDGLKAGIEHLSGFSMSDVKVHYNSSKPAALQAHAYAQGTQIHLAPGQERHLPHEAWHVVQQKQGRVRPTLQYKGMGVNDDEGLESEADRMGALALRSRPALPFTPPTATGNGAANLQRMVVQREGEDFLSNLLTPQGLYTIAAMTVTTAYLAYSWWPQGRRPADLYYIARAIGFVRLNLAGDVLALARLNWDINQVIALAANIGNNANGLSAGEWVNIARRVNVDDTAGATALARLNNWDFDNIYGLAGDRLALNPANHTAAQWATLAGRLPANAREGARAMARVANWNFAALDQLAQNYAAANPRNLTPQQWAALCAYVPIDSHAGATAFARMANWTFAAIDQLGQNLVAGNLRNFTPQQWAAIGTQAGADTHAQTTLFARMDVWSADRIAELAGFFRTHNPANRDAQAWIDLGPFFVDIPASVRDFMQLPAGWTNVGIIGLARLFQQNNGNRSAATWCTIAAANANLYNQRDTVATFARMPLWSNVGLTALATHYGTDANGLTANQWADIASAGANLTSQADRVRDFARMPHWTPQNIITLATGYATGNPRDFTVAEWVDLANNSHDNVRNKPVSIIAFARMANWNQADIRTLAGQYGLYNPRNFTAAEWITIANAHNSLHNQAANVARFAVMGNWNHANIVLLAQARAAANPRNFTVAQWISLANDGVPLHNQENDVARFARMGNWAYAHIRTLAQHYCANNNARSAEDWVLIAAHHNNLLDHPDDARDFALLSNQITRTELITIAGHLLNGAITMANTRQLIGQLHPAISGANLALLVPAVATRANLVAVQPGTYGGNSFAALTTLLINTGRWTAAQVGAAVEEFDTPGNAPTANVFCRLLDVSHRHARLAPGNLVTVLQNENPGAAGDWDTACAEFDDFMTAGHAQPAGPFDTNGAVVTSAIYNSVGAPNIQVQVQYRQNRLNHFEAGHTFNHFLFTFANTHRAGSPYSFWTPAAANVQPQVDVVVNNGLVTEAADSIRNNIFTQRIRPGYEAGFAPQGVALPLVANQQYTTEITQFYPMGANVLRRVSGSILHLVGRLMGFY